MAKVRFPYGISNFQSMVEQGYHYVDRTIFLEKLEQMHSKYHFFLRPRRFGKSLAVSVMEYYYGKEFKAEFEKLFGKYYIGQHPTPLANSYLVLKFDFSGIPTDDFDAIVRGFHFKVVNDISTSLIPWMPQISEEDVETIRQTNDPAAAMSTLFKLIESRLPGQKVFVIIDEYDHFTNEIIAFHFDNFQQIVSRNGVVRKFYEVIKQGTQTNLVDRVFVTGVSPVTLDSLTSGFNIGDNISMDLTMHDFMGFTETEVGDFLRFAGVPEDKFDATLDDLRAWYNGYMFNPDASNRLYNPSMVLYFAMKYDMYKKYPDSLLDTNVSSDYGKIRRMFQVGSAEGNMEVLEELMENGELSAEITRQFSFEKKWTSDDFVSLLFYMGLLTLKEKGLTDLKFQMPNHVMSELYFQFFQDVLLEQVHLHADDLRVRNSVGELALNNNLKPFLATLEQVLKRLSNRDARKFSEKYVKVAMMSLLVPTGIYGVWSEYPVGQEYADIVMLRRPPILEPKFQFVFELKFLKKSEADRLEAVAEEGRTQLRRYLSHPDLARHADMVAYLLVFVGYEAKVVEQVTLSNKIPSSNG